MKMTLTFELQKIGFDILVRNKIVTGKEKLSKVNVITKENVIDITNQNSSGYNAIARLKLFNHVIA